MRKIFILLSLVGCTRQIIISDLCPSNTHVYFNGERMCKSCNTIECDNGCQNINGIPTCINEGNSYIISAVDDGLDNNDMYIMSKGFDSMGYNVADINEDTSSQYLKTYIEQGVNTVYHTGHGFQGGILTSDFPVFLENLTNKSNSNTVIFATCLTLKADWTPAFGNSSHIFGYSKKSWDVTDDFQAKLYIQYLQSGYTELVSWMMSNMATPSLNDRWVAYVREGNNIVKHEPKLKYKPNYKGHYSETNTLNINDTPITVSFVDGEADNIDQPDLVLDEVSSLNKNNVEVGKISIYVKTFNDLKVRGTYKLYIYNIESDTTTIITYLPDFTMGEELAEWRNYTMPVSKLGMPVVMNKEPVYIIQNGIAVPGYDLLTDFGSATVLSGK